MAKAKTSIVKKPIELANPLHRREGETVEDRRDRIGHHANKHRLGAVHGLYTDQINAITKPEANGIVDSTLYAAAMPRIDLEPKDSAEAMLIDQLTLLHGRFLWLTSLAHRQTGLKQIQIINEACDRCSNQYRRAMQTLSDYRNPRKVVFNKIDQQNNADQQLVANGIPNENATNKQGFLPAPPAMLPADSGRPAIAAIIDQVREALAAEHRAENPRGQSGGKPKRVQTRRAVR